MSLEICKFDGCDRFVYAKKAGLCRTHYMQQWMGKPLTPIREYKEAAPAAPGYRVCPTCEIEKPAEDYYLRTNGGLQHECKDCTKARVTARNLRIKAEQAAERARKMNEYQDATVNSGGSQ